MTLASRTRYLAYLLGLFLAGVAVGALFTLRISREKVFQPPQLEDLTAHLEHRFQDGLKLTPEQLQKLRPILERCGRDFQNLHRDTMGRIDDIIRKAEAEISRDLTPEQTARLAEMERERNTYQQRNAPR